MTQVFFGFQVAVHAPPHEPWRRRLATLLRDRQQDLPPDRMAQFGHELDALLAEAIAHMPLGCWDFVADGQHEYDDWVRGIEDDSAESWLADPSGARQDHVLVSVLLLLPAGGRSANLCGQRCDLPEAHWRRRATYRQLFGTLPLLDAASVRSIACYLTPGGDREAFSLRELQGDGYDYLLPID